MGKRFSDELREQNADTWDKAISHRFVKELFAGTIDDAILASYLTQDYRFFDGFLALVGAAVASADTLDARLPLARFTGAIAGDENTYFQRAFEALGVSDQLRAETSDLAPTVGFDALFREAANTREYAAVLAVLTVSEWLYLDWAITAPVPGPTSFLHADWISLHDYPEFHEVVEFLRSELDRVGPSHREIAEDFFGRAVQFEYDFFETTYNTPLEGISR